MATKTAEADTAQAAGGGSKKKLIIIVAVALVALVAVYMLVLKPKKTPAEGAAKPEPKPGVIATLDPITINLAGGHFLKLGMALQADAKAHEVDGAKALDAAISLLSGETVEELAKPAGREKAKKELVKEVAEAYEDEVYDIYFTEFVMQ